MKNNHLPHFLFFYQAIGLCINFHYQRILSLINMEEIDPLQQEIPRKKSLCRFYVRGLCIFKKEDCQFSHGISDIDYHYWQKGEEVETDYLQDTVFCQKKAKKGPRIYINLYEFQTEKKYTLEQLNAQRPLRVQVRNQMHRKMFEEFIQLLQQKFPGANLTQDMLMRQYTRVGFNKLMTRIKFSHLTSFLCDSQNSKFFKKTLVMPPMVKRQVSFIIRKASQEEIVEAYRQEYQKIMKQNENGLQETLIKKKLYQMVMPSIHIPPLSSILKEKRLNFTDFLVVLNGSSLQDQMDKIKLQAKPEEILEMAINYLNKEGPTRLVTWNELYIQLSKQLKINNGNILNQIKPMLALQGYKLLFFPNNQLIYNQSFNYPFEAQRLHICQCKFGQHYNQQQMEQFTSAQRPILQEGESIDITNKQTLLKYGPILLDSKIVAVDLEGNLRKGGFVELIQINNERNTFLFDIFFMNQNKDNETIELSKKLLRNVFVNPSILKIFHDCRHDSLALHEFMQTCIINVFDTSASETVIMQLQAYDSLKTLEGDRLAKAKGVIAECANIRTLGLNEILKRYGASHGINKNKDKFHKMWSSGEVKFFCQRPMNPDYRQYCIKDVLDLPEIYRKVANKIPKQTLQLCQWLASNYSLQGFLNTTYNVKQADL